MASERVFLLDRWEVPLPLPLSPSPSPRRVAVMKVPARSRPAKGWPSLMKTDEAEIKCLPTLRDSSISVSPPPATEHLGGELLRRARGLHLPAPAPLSDSISVYIATEGGFSCREVLFGGTFIKWGGIRGSRGTRDLRSDPRVCWAAI